MIGKKLNLAVDAQLDVTSISGGHGFTQGLHHAPHSVFDDTPGAGFACQILVESELNPLLPQVFHIGEAHNVSRRLSLGVLALVFLALVNSLQPHGHNLLGDGIIDLTLHPHKCLVLSEQFFVQFCDRHFQQLCQACRLIFVEFYILGNGPDTHGRHA